MIDKLAGLKCSVVLGNNDNPTLLKYARRLGIDCHSPLAQTTIDGKSIAVIHGDDIRLRRQLIQEQRHDYLFLGHTHTRSDTLRPRAGHQPRHPLPHGHQGRGLLDTVNDSLKFIDLVEE